MARKLDVETTVASYLTGQPTRCGSLRARLSADVRPIAAIRPVVGRLCWSRLQEADDE